MGHAASIATYFSPTPVTNNWAFICFAHFLQDSRLSSIGSTQNEHPESRKLLPDINTVRRTWQGLGIGMMMIDEIDCL